MIKFSTNKLLKERKGEGMNKKCADKNIERTAYQLSQLCIAKYIVVVVERGVTIEVNYFNSLKDAKQAFGEIAHDYGYEPEEINDSARCNVSIWEWTEDRYEKVFKS